MIQAKPKLDDGPTKLIQKRAEEHAKHGFHLNLNESPAYEDYNQSIINTLEKMLADGLNLNTRRQMCNKAKLKRARSAHSHETSNQRGTERQ